jgi:hypothetical protein
MERDAGVVGTLLDSYNRVTASDVASFDRLVSADPATLVLGTAPGESVTERDRLHYGFEAGGYGIEAGPTPVGYASGHLGWFVVAGHDLRSCRALVISGVPLTGCRRASWSSACSRPC